MRNKIFLLTALCCIVTTLHCAAWDYEGHRLVNELALSCLTADFPAFARSPENAERIAFLAGEADRWKNVGDLNHFNNPDHYFDLEELADYGLDMKGLTHFRYDFVAELGVARAMHPEKFPAINADYNKDHTRHLIGFLPWAIMENYDKLKSSFSYLKALQNNHGTEQEIANAEKDAVYIMGVMGHYVGDCSQPLHTTKSYNGWTGANPEGFTTEHIHGKVDGYFAHMDEPTFVKIRAALHPASKPQLEPWGKEADGDLFNVIKGYIMDGNSKVKPLYQLEKEGKLFGEGEKGAAGNEFLTRQLVIGGQMLGDLWYDAWITAQEDTYLSRSLQKRGKPPL